MLLLAALLGLASAAVGAPVQPTCPALISAAGASAEFANYASHVVHSITLEDLRKFKPDVGAANGVPTVNMELQATEWLTTDAPSRPHAPAGKFLNEGQRVLYGVLSHMDDANWGIHGFSTLERIAHAFHMEELFARALQAYRGLNTSRLDAATCACINDDAATGLRAALESRARGIHGKAKAAVEETRRPPYEFSLPDTAKAPKDGYKFSLPDGLKQSGPQGKAGYSFHLADKLKEAESKDGYKFSLPDGLKQKGAQGEDGYSFHLADKPKETEGKDGYKFSLPDGLKQEGPQKEVGYSFSVADKPKGDGKKDGYKFSLADKLKQAGKKDGYKFSLADKPKSEQKKDGYSFSVVDKPTDSEAAVKSPNTDPLVAASGGEGYSFHVGDAPKAKPATGEKEGAEGGYMAGKGRSELAGAALRDCASRLPAYLRSAEGWQAFNGGLGDAATTEVFARDAALYLYCKLNY